MLVCVHVWTIEVIGNHWDVFVEEWESWWLNDQPDQNDQMFDVWMLEFARDVGSGGADLGQDQAVSDDVRFALY